MKMVLQKKNGPGEKDRRQPDPGEPSAVRLAAASGGGAAGLFGGMLADPWSIRTFRRWFNEQLDAFRCAADKRYQDRLFRWSVGISTVLLFFSAWVSALLRDPGQSDKLFSPQNRLLEISHHTLVVINAVPRTTLSKRRVKVPKYVPSELALKELDIPEPELGSLEVGPEEPDETGGVPGDPGGKARLRRPELMMLVPPVYPRDAEKKKIEGTVDLRIHVAASGTVDKVEIITSSGLQSMDDAAVKAAMKTRFRPAVRDGRRIDMWISYPIQFQLNKK
ncbi:MAG: energy transducer TonB [Candidatus Glassbacteria bacterium]|nr:energy transducer TonB [Candidatus Glassbacteria bacterium]